MGKQNMRNTLSTCRFLFRGFKDCDKKYVRNSLRSILECVQVNLCFSLA